MVIGGLIKENDTVTQSKVPYLGNVKGVGWLFRRSEVTKERVEIIVALVPRIQPYDSKWQAYEQGELVRTNTPLLHGPLCRTDRPWDPVLPDGKRVKYPLIPNKHHRPKTGYYHDMDGRYIVPPYPLPEQHFVGDTDDCESGEGQLQDQPTKGPILSEQDLPLPEAADPTSGGNHIITDEPTTDDHQPGANR
jgi:type II/III secretion system protein